MDYLEGIEETVSRALAEDVGEGDITASLIDAGTHAVATVITREAATVCGQPWVDEVFRQVDDAIQVAWQVGDGDTVYPGSVLFSATGPARSLLTAERTALNFLQLLSGIATRTRACVDIVADTGVTLLDTRKTLPGLRLAQKYAVKTGGAENHRIGLFDAFLIKENHIEAVGSIGEAISRARQIQPGVRVEVEVESLAQLKEAVTASPDWVMLDNFSLPDMRTAAKTCEGTGIRLEASGGIDGEDALVAIAETGVDYISIGALTKHCRAIDLSMRFE